MGDLNFNSNMVRARIAKMTELMFKDDDVNPHPDSENFDFWLRKKVSNFTEQDWKIMTFAYQRAKKEGYLK